jgi:hypothetical protein
MKDFKKLSMYDEIKKTTASNSTDPLLGLANVSGSLLSDVDYWKQRCQLAEKCIEESLCDPDITSDQIKAHNAYNKFISNFGNDR